jgi:hypothetical protein
MKKTKEKMAAMIIFKWFYYLLKILRYILEKKLRGH